MAAPPHLGTLDFSQRGLAGDEGHGRIDDDAGLGVIDDVGVGPAEEDGEFVTETDEEGDVDEQPGKPGDEAAHPKSAGFHDGVVFSDDRHHSLVEVVKARAEIVLLIGKSGFFEAELFLEDFGDVGPHLDGGGGNAGNRLVVDVPHADKIASDKDFRMPGEMIS